MEAYSFDLCERIVRACDSRDESRKQIAARFGVSGSWIRRLLQRRRGSGAIATRPYRRGPQPKISGPRQDRPEKLVKEYADVTIEGFRRRMRLKRSVSTIHLVFKR